jgi:hypothetical protein
MVKIILFVLFVLITVAVCSYVYFGGFNTVQFNLAEQGGETLVYQDMIGDYKNSGMLMDSVYYTLLNEYNIQTYKGFGIYYDNPQKVNREKLRSEIGCIIEENDYPKIDSVKAKYKVKTFPRKTYIVTEFPSKGKLSIIIGIIKVYPAMIQYVKTHKYNDRGFVMEIYDTPGKKIIYRKEIVSD